MNGAEPARPQYELGEALGACLGRGDGGPTAAVDRLMEEAAQRGASDVHLEPREDGVLVRLRIDGQLHPVARLPLHAHPRLISRLKVLANLLSYEHHLPQEGRVEPDASPAGVAMRVATFPTVYGEKAAIRLQHAAAQLIPLEELGFREALLDDLRRLARLPHGVILLTGPSSSGKTTTIYALLRAIEAARDPAPQIVTLEDPVEHRLGTVVQTEVRPAAGFTFEAAFRSLLRQDPEVIMLGEVRDAATARLVVQAGLSGHLVIATIHSGTAAGVYTRLLDMGIEPYLLASSVTAVLAQRLVRRVCPECAAPDAPAPPVLEAFGIAADQGRWRAGRGCEACGSTGYSGRMAVGELLLASDALSAAVLGRPTTGELHRMAVAAGMAPLAGDVVRCAAAGMTTLAEAARVLGQDVRL